ncbi:MAG TPA: filamentous hemagglutinin N-terminal domain-containing protein, partial [Novosphingobium sp.]|nr:filamentous hemagglutinin N-terminal domain-containing protein [Novosphingobium sp.]
MTAATTSKRRALRLGTAFATCLTCVLGAQAAFGQSLTDLGQRLPTGFNEVAGNAVVLNSSNATKIDIDVRTDKAVIEWNTFSIDAGRSVNFFTSDRNGNNPNIGDIVTDARSVLNRVVGTDATTIFPSLINGQLTGPSNLSIWLVNPAGITFGPSGTFSGGSLVLSTLGITNAQFDSGGSQQFVRNPLTGMTVETVEFGAGPTAVEPLVVQLYPTTNPAAATQINSAGSVLVVGEKIVTGRNITATDNAVFVAASDVTFPGGVGSPLSFTINAGTEMSGIEIASGTVSGRTILAAAVSKGGAVDALLNVAAPARLTAAAVDGVITLRTLPQTITPDTPGGDGLVVDGNLAAGADIQVLSGARADLSGDFTAGQDIVITSQDDLDISSDLDAGRFVGIQSEQLAKVSGGVAAG